MPFISLSEYVGKYTRFQPIDIREAPFYQEGHLPNALHIPLVLKQNDFQHALSTWRKYQLVDSDVWIENFSAARLALSQLEHRSSDLLLYDEEGGVSSRILDLVFDRTGKKYLFLDGGFAAFKKYQQRFFHQARSFYFLTGKTGCGKTRLLRALSSLGASVMDLEVLANHRGSVFGGRPGSKQPTIQEFHNRLWRSLGELGSGNGIFVEQKGEYLGKCSIPRGLSEQFKTARQIRLIASFSFRVSRLKSEYAHLTNRELAVGLSKLKSKLDKSLFADCQQAIDEGDRDHFIRNMLRYYDQTRTYQTNRENAWLEVDGETDNPEELGERILSLI